jgi:hypothetical protein
LPVIADKYNHPAIHYFHVPTRFVANSPEINTSKLSIFPDCFYPVIFTFQRFNIHDLKQRFMLFAPVGYLPSPYFAPEPDGTWGRMVVFSGRNNRLSDSGAWQ